MTADQARDMTYILLNTPNLRTLEFRGRCLPPNMLSIPLHIAAGSLNSLKVRITEDLLVEAQHIGQLQRLRSLDLYSHADWSSACLTWDMPNLTKLRWQGWVDGLDAPPCHGDVDFLRQCRFTGLRTVLFTLRRVVSVPSEAETESLRDLLSGWTKEGRIQDLNIYLHSTELSAVIPRLRCSAISLDCTSLDSMIGKLLHPEIKDMVLTVHEDDVDNLCPLLTGLMERTEPLGLQQIKIVCFLSYLPTFSWSYKGKDPLQMPRQAAEFLGRLLPLTLRLSARGIHIVDEGGHAIFSPL
jgi:hypothetical protein